MRFTGKTGLGINLSDDLDADAELKVLHLCIISALEDSVL